MENQRDIILQLKEVRKEKNLSLQNIMDMMQKNGDYISKATLSRILAEGSENTKFKYNETIRPIAKALLDIEHIEDEDTLDIKTMKLLLKYKIDKIKDLESQLVELKAQLSLSQEKFNERIEKERSRHERSIDFLKHQIDLKDKRMDFKDEQNRVLLEQLLSKCNGCRQTG